MVAAARPADVRAHDFGFTYRGSTKAALDELEFHVPAGACLLVVGPSGSGKSTLGLALSGLIPRELPGTWRGSLTVDGIETRAFPPGALAARAGLVFQDPTRQVVMDRVEDDVAFGLESRAWSRAAMRERVPAALDEVGLRGFGRRPTRELSGGQRQRLALAGVMAATPGLLVLDEPTANLDPDGAAVFFEQLTALRTARTATIVLVEHRAAAAWPIADLVLALGRDGTPIAFGSPGSVLAEDGPRLAAVGIWLPDDGPVSRFRERPSVAPPAVGAPLLVARDVTYGYDRRTPVVEEVALEAAAGERIALVGSNGGGKSTLGRLLVGLLRPDRGSVRLRGDDPARLPAAVLARRGGYVFQEPERQFLGQTVRDEVMLGLRDDEANDVDALLERLDLPPATFGSRSPYRLSGGEQRRLSLATALVRRPDLLILDEPTFGQDHSGYDGLLEILRERLEAGTCLIAATHDERFVADVAERVIRFEAGRIVTDEVVP
jgi:energy-coupling factor transport system ATP-binding protein